MSVFLWFRRRRLRGLSGDAAAGGMLDSARLVEYAAFAYPNTRNSRTQRCMKITAEGKKVSFEGWEGCFVVRSPIMDTT